MTDLVLRLTALAQLAVLLGCGLGWHISHREHIPRQAWLVGWGYGYVIAVVAAAITLNAVLSEHLTLGLRALTVLLVPATVWIVVLTVRASREAAAQAAAVLAWVDNLDHLEPCPTTDCMHQRDEIRAIVRRRDRRQRQHRQP